MAALRSTDSTEEEDLVTLPVRVERPDPPPEPITASTLTANIVLMNQMTTSEVWVSPDDEGD